MDISQISQLISLVLAVSLASERLIALLKTLIPWLVSPPPAPAGTPVVGTEKWRQLIVMLIAFLTSWLTTSFLNGKFDPWALIIIIKGAASDNDVKLYAVFIALLASGGSAFWTSLLGYTNTVKDLKKQQFVKDKLAMKAQLFDKKESNCTCEKPAEMHLESSSVSGKTTITKRSQIAVSVETEIRQIILDVSELPGGPSDLDPTSTLSGLGFNDAMCNRLARELNKYVKTINPGGGVTGNEITSAMNVQQVIDLVKQKISQ